MRRATQGPSRIECRCYFDRYAWTIVRLSRLNQVSGAESRAFAPCASQPKTSWDKDDVEWPEPARARAYEALFPVYRDGYAALPGVWRRMQAARETINGA